MNASKILAIFFLFLTSFAMFLPPRIYCQKATRSHAEIIILVDQYAKEILIEELGHMGIGNLFGLDHVKSYFKALQKDFLVTDFENKIIEIKREVVNDLRGYFYLSNDQIRNKVYIMLYPFLEQVRKNIK